MDTLVKKRGLRALFGAQDMTVGSPLRSMLVFTVPLLVGNILQLLYNTVDSIVVGQYGGPNQLAAIGSSTPVVLMFAVFFMTVGTGVSVMVSQYFGAKDRKSLEKTVGNSLILIVIATVTATALGLALSRWVLTITNCPPEVFDWALSYLRIVILGFIGMGFYNILSGILRGFGDAVFPLMVLAGTTVLNIFLDIWMVAPKDKLFGIGLGMGVAGAAWATIISQTISAIVCLFRLLRMTNIITITSETLKLDKKICKQIVRIGVPSGLQQMVMSMSFLFVQSIINSILIPFGTDVVTGATLFDGAMFIAINTAIGRIDGFAMMPAQTFNQTASTFTGQNVGAGRLDRVTKGFKLCLILALGVTLIVFLSIWFGGRGLMRMFVSGNRTEVIETAVSDKFLREDAVNTGYDDITQYLDAKGVSSVEAIAVSAEGKTLVARYVAEAGYPDLQAYITVNGEADALFYAQSRGFDSIDEFINKRIEKIIEIGFTMQRILVWCYFLMATANTVGGVMRGAGDTVAQLIIMLSTNIAVRIPLTLLLVKWSKSAEYPYGNPKMIYISMIAAFGLNVLVSCIYFSTGKWKTKAVVKHKPAFE